MACVVNSEWNFSFLDIDCMHTEGDILPLLSVELTNIPLLRLPSHISADHMTFRQSDPYIWSHDLAKIAFSH